MQVMKALQQQQMLQAAGSIEGLVALLQTSPGDTSTIHHYTTTLTLHRQTHHTGLEVTSTDMGCKTVHTAKPSCCCAHWADLDYAGSAGM